MNYSTLLLAAGMEVAAPDPGGRCGVVVVERP